MLEINDFFSLRKSLPVVDVRSEGEFAAGHIPAASNIPLLNNAERIAVGTMYKQQGQRDAIREGFRLVGPRLSEMIATAEQIGPEFIVHCWRGGMRSANFCQFSGMIGLKTHQLRGGYKAYRRAALESFLRPYRFQVISGLTGSGKSELLRTLKGKGEQVIDLETLASHKGSVFGGLCMPPQPTTEQFENDLFEELSKLDIEKRVWIEDESIAIGKIFLPSDFWKNLNRGSIIEIDVPKNERIARLVSEYQSVPVPLFLEAMKGITKRLGGQHFNTACEKLFAGDIAGTIEIILSYYDKAYANSMEKKKERIIQKHTWDGGHVSSFADFLASEGLPLPKGLSV